MRVELVAVYTAMAWALTEIFDLYRSAVMLALNGCGGMNTSVEPLLFAGCFCNNYCHCVINPAVAFSPFHRFDEKRANLSLIIVPAIRASVC